MEKHVKLKRSALRKSRDFRFCLQQNQQAKMQAFELRVSASRSVPDDNYRLGVGQIPFPVRHLPFADPYPRSLQLAWLGEGRELA